MKISEILFEEMYMMYAKFRSLFNLLSFDVLSAVRWRTIKRFADSSRRSQIFNNKIYRDSYNNETPFPLMSSSTNLNHLVPSHPTQLSFKF
jgi:hypothetical protein